MKPTVKIELNETYAYVVEGKLIPEVVQNCQINYAYWTRDFWSKQVTQKSRILNYLYLHEGIYYFPAGWVPKIKQVYEDFGYEVTLVNISKKIVKPSPITNSFIPRDYQTSIITQALEMRRGIIGAPTGSGKTSIYGAILFYLGARALIIVPSLNLLNQTANELKKYLTDKSIVGMIGDSEWDPQLITVATRDTLWNRFKTEPKTMRKFFSDIMVLVVDEAHHIKNSGYNPKNTYFKLVMEIQAPYRYGATATPGAEGGLSRMLLEAATGPVIGEIPMTELIEKGYLVRPRVEMRFVNIPNSISNWHKAYTTNIVGNEDRNFLIKELAETYAAQGKSVLIVCNWVEKHARVLHRLMPQANLMIGETDSDSREIIKEEFSSKDSKILISTVIQEGVNIPSMDVIILASAGKGGDEGRMQIQRIGRVMRPSNGKSSALVIDFYDKDGSILERHSKGRLKIYNQEDAYEVHLETNISKPTADRYQPRGIAGGWK